jgi:hypothetical protein
VAERWGPGWPEICSCFPFAERENRPTGRHHANSQGFHHTRACGRLARVQAGACRDDAPHRHDGVRYSHRKAHERLVDNPPWLYIVHDLNPRAMSPKVKGFVSPQSWFVDLTLVSVQ